MMKFKDLSKDRQKRIESLVFRNLQRLGTIKEFSKAWNYVLSQLETGGYFRPEQEGDKEYYDKIIREITDGMSKVVTDNRTVQQRNEDACRSKAKIYFRNTLREQEFIKEFYRLVERIVVAKKEKSPFRSVKVERNLVRFTFMDSVFIVTPYFFVNTDTGEVYYDSTKLIKVVTADGKKADTMMKKVYKKYFDVFYSAPDKVLLESRQLEEKEVLQLKRMVDLAKNRYKLRVGISKERTSMVVHMNEYMFIMSPLYVKVRLGNKTVTLMRKTDELDTQEKMGIALKGGLNKYIPRADMKLAVYTIFTKAMDLRVKTTHKKDAVQQPVQSPTPQPNPKASRPVRMASNRPVKQPIRQQPKQQLSPSMRRSARPIA